MAGARIIVLDSSGNILAINERGRGYEEGWNIPGGKIEDGEYPIQAAIREVFEETGVELEPGELTGPIQSMFGKHPQIYFLARLVEQLPVRESKEGAVAWVPIEAVLTSGNPMTNASREALQEFGVL